LRNRKLCFFPGVRGPRGPLPLKEAEKRRLARSTQFSRNRIPALAADAPSHRRNHSKTPVRRRKFQDMNFFGPGQRET